MKARNIIVPKQSLTSAEVPTKPTERTVQNKAYPRYTEVLSHHTSKLITNTQFTNNTDINSTPQTHYKIRHCTQMQIMGGDYRLSDALPTTGLQHSTHNLRL